MNPELPQAQPSIETLPPTPGSLEAQPDNGVAERERGNVERPAPVATEPPVPHAALPTIAQDTTVAPPPVAPTPAQSMISGAPSIAGDDDLIEKEWVDKLKRIISLTKEDPYERARVIAQLQADYLKKRHNREVGQSNG